MNHKSNIYSGNPLYSFHDVEIFSAKSATKLCLLRTTILSFPVSTVTKPQNCLTSVPSLLRQYSGK